MKQWSLIRKTLKSLGFTSKTSENVEVVSIENDATVNYKDGDSTFSGNISTNTTSIDVEEVVDQLTATTGYIDITNGDITLSSGSTETLILKNEDGVTLTNTDFTYSTSNSARVTVSSDGVVTGVSVGSATITVKETADTSVYSKIKVYVTE